MNKFFKYFCNVATTTSLSSLKDFLTISSNQSNPSLIIINKFMHSTYPEI
jgi:hypothetical protein